MSEQAPGYGARCEDWIAPIVEDDSLGKELRAKAVGIAADRVEAELAQATPFS